MYVCIYVYVYTYMCIHIYIYIYNCMLRPLRKANAETRRVLNKALKTEAHSPLCKLYIYIYIYIYMPIRLTALGKRVSNVKKSMC